MTKINDKAVLVQLKLSLWSGRKFDKKATADVARSHGVSDEVGRYNKALLPANDSLANVTKQATKIRTFFYEQTLPWSLQGVQLLPTANYLTFQQEFRSLRLEYERLVGRFVYDYEDLKREARTALKSLYNEDDYPMDIASKFGVDLAVFPVPSTDFRVELSDGDMESIRQDVEERLRAASKQAMQDVWRRLYDVVEAMHQKLSDPTAIFRDSLVGNAKEIVDLLPRLNFDDDPELEKLRREVANKLAVHHADNLRHDPVLRHDTATKAKSIMDAMSVFMGGQP